ncbi:hypothetical protein ELI07_33400 (plasmid) [Rhizobium leguminosarum]|nr:hypothetical protein ELI07_33400 [Rhizobium leguminosarum]
MSEMPKEPANHDDELRDIIDQKLTALIREMEDADWSARDVAFAINDVLKSKRLDRMTADRSRLGRRSVCGRLCRYRVRAPGLILAMSRFKMLIAKR